MLKENLLSKVQRNAPIAPQETQVALKAIPDHLEHEVRTLSSVASIGDTKSNSRKIVHHGPIAIGGGAS